MVSSKIHIVDIETSDGLHAETREQQEPSQFRELLQEYCPGSNGFLAMWVDGFPQRIRRVKYPRLRVACGTFLQLGFIFIFCSLLYATYISNANAAFLSLSRTAGTCSSVPITTSKGILLDSYGHWETDSKFVKQEALYFVQFSEYDGDNESWEIDMANLNGIISTELDFLKATDDYPLKILHLGSWRKTFDAEKGGSITVWFNADPAAIFDQQAAVFQAYVGKPSDGCKPIDAWRYAISQPTTSCNMPCCL